MVLYLQFDTLCWTFYLLLCWVLVLKGAVQIYSHQTFISWFLRVSLYELGLVIISYDDVYVVTDFLFYRISHTEDSGGSSVSCMGFESGVQVIGWRKPLS